MIVAVASGKGGVGKTTVAVNLALAAEEEVILLDSDVEEPNAHLLLRPEIEKETPVPLLVPVFHRERCTGCGKCIEVCAYHALALIGRELLIFDKMCHACGGCIYFCPEKALTEGERVIGILQEGRAGKVRFVQGRMSVGEALAVPVIKKLREKQGAHTIIDCPPGTSCPVIQAVKGADFCLVVTEPTPFGQHDLRLLIEMLRVLKVPAGVIINRADLGDEEVEEYCRQEGIPVLLKIPFDLEIARSFAAGVPFVARLPRWRQAFSDLWQRLKRKGVRA
ncbi:Cobyrinic acid ac-diamide synthase [Ammonifex degensii KC4]|uniref:Cobyrinic acid ac-diamide synthase n=1 Tax=Ammonifex degensii (strain DSM 10501 / KC4) TaxID=429009 RepID=C9RD88_AMMDK|nr:ATP-binding protein [Ammonifex degensii]ACX52215.1 Cobyrinic acid ac-diamide synthase [Ammonifex degensii KC4]